MLTGIKRLVPHSLNRTRSRLLVSAETLLERILPEGIRRHRKENWEFKWQRDNWAEMYKDAKVKSLACEYWEKFRHLNEITSRIKIGETTKVLDVGCGISTVLEFVPGQRVGIDPLADRYKTIYNYPADIEIRNGYGEAIPFADTTFDVVFCSNSIDHHEHPERTINDMRRVLKPGGYLVLTCETFTDDIGVRNVGHPHSMTTERLLQLVAAFDVLEHWDSPWYGLFRYALGQPPRASREQILLLRKL